jgi:hypothetical protein
LRPGFFGSALGRLLRERGCLTLTGTMRLLELLLEAFDLGLQFGDAAVALETGQAEVSIHPHQDSKKARRQLRRPIPPRATPGPDPLDKYLFFRRLPLILT